MIDLTAIILTYNEAINIEDCLRSLEPICKRIIIVDSYSTDETVEICKQYGCDIYQRHFTNHSEQFEYGLNIAKIDTKWVIRLDADERLSEESSVELEKLCNENSDSDVNGFVLRFKYYFLGKYLKHGGYYPIRKLAVFKYGKAHIERKQMDEHIVLDSGKLIECKKDCLHHDCKSISDWIAKHNKYSSNEVADYFNNSILDVELLDPNARRKNRAKHNFYYKLPLGLRARLYYFYRFYLKLGFLDGRPGKYFAFLHAYWYRYLVDIKIYEQKHK